MSIKTNKNKAFLWYCDTANQGGIWHKTHFFGIKCDLRYKQIFNVVLCQC